VTHLNQSQSDQLSPADYTYPKQTHNDNYIRRAHRTLNSVLCCLIQRAMRMLYKTPQDAIRCAIVSGPLVMTFLLTYPTQTRSALGPRFAVIGLLYTHPSVG